MPRIQAFAVVLFMILVGRVGIANAGVESVGVFKTQFHRQSSAVDVAPQPAGFPPFVFDVDVDGTDLGAIAAPSVSGPISYGEPGHNGGELGFVQEDESEGWWGYGAPDFQGVGFSTQGEMDAAFGSGTYTVNVLGEVVALDLSGDAYPSAPPLLTLTGGTWVDDVYRIDVDAELIITTNTFVEYGTTDSLEAIYLGLFGDDFGDEVSQIASETASNTATLTVPSGSLTPGATYLVEAGFVATSDVVDEIPNLPDAFGAAGYEQVTELIVEVNEEVILGDMDGNGVLDAFDVAPFELALADKGAYVIAFPGRDPDVVGDMDGSGSLDAFDVAGFEVALAGGASVPEPAAGLIAMVGVLALVVRRRERR